MHLIISFVLWRSEFSVSAHLVSDLHCKSLKKAMIFDKTWPPFMVLVQKQRVYLLSYELHSILILHPTLNEG